MAKYEKIVHGNFDEILDTLDSAVLNGSSSASFEDGSDYSCGDFRCAGRVYERFSYIGSNRVSMALTLAGSNGQYLVSAITSGGSQAIFFKINTWGEDAFLETIADVIEQMG